MAVVAKKKVFYAKFSRKFMESARVSAKLGNISVFKYKSTVGLDSGLALKSRVKLFYQDAHGFEYSRIVMFKKKFKKIGFGLFSDLNGYGLVVRVKHAGVSVDFPVYLKSNRPLMDKALFQSVLESFQAGISVYLGGMVVSWVADKLWRATRDWIGDRESNFEEKFKQRREAEQFVEAMRSIALVKQEKEAAKNTRGLLIEYAFVGRRDVIDEIFDEDSFGTLDLESFRERTADFHEELIEVTVPLQYAIEETEGQSSLFLYSTNKEEIIGIVNPLLKQPSEARMIIKYTARGTQHFCLRNIEEVFQIPEQLIL